MGDTFDVDVVKGIQVYKDESTGEVRIVYLTSWVGYADAEDTWEPESSFNDKSPIEALENIVPATFNRTKVGQTWFAGEEWIEEQRREYYLANRELAAEWERKKELNRMQNVDPQAQNRTKVERTPTGLSKSAPKKTRLLQKNPKSSKFSERRPKPAPSSSHYVAKTTKDKFVPSLRFRKPQPLLSDVHYSMLSSHPHTKTATRSSTPVTRLGRQQKPRVIFSPIETPRMSVNNEPDHDSLFTASSSDEDVPLSEQVNQPAETIPSSSRLDTLKSSKYDSTVPLSAAVLRKQQPPKPISNAIGTNKATESRHSSFRSPMIDESLAPNDTCNPFLAKADACKSVKKSIPVKRNEPPIQAAMRTSKQLSIKPPTISEDLQTPTPVMTIPTSGALRSKGQSTPFQETLAGPVISNEKSQQELPMDLDDDNFALSMDPIRFIQSAVKTATSPSTPMDTTGQKAVNLVVDAGRGPESLCRVRMKRITRTEDGVNSLKWICAEGSFKIRSIRPMAQLALLSHKLKPWQYAEVIADDPRDEANLKALTTYLSHDNSFILTETELTDYYICLHPSHPMFSDFLRIPSTSELRQGPTHLLVTVLKVHINTPVPDPFQQWRSVVGYEWYHPKSKTWNKPSFQRGYRILRFPMQLLSQLQRRKMTYTVFTEESLSLRYGTPRNVCEIPPSKEAPEKYGIYHREETLALIAVMDELQFTPCPAVKSSNIVFIHNGAWNMLRHFLGFHARLSDQKTWFFCYGPYHALDSRLWGVREVFKRGGIMTFTVGSILESSSRFTKILECIDKSASTWVAYISPLVIGVLQARAIREPKNDEALNALFKVLEAVKNGLLAIQSAPPNPWKLDEWSKWLSTNLEMGLPSQLGINSPDADEGILEAAERALEEFIAKDQRSSGKSGLQDFRVPQASIPSLENKVDQQVFEDMRQMMLIPYLHTEYRLFIALRDDRDPSEVLDKRRKNEPLPNRQIDSIGHYSFASLPYLDRAVFGPLESNSSTTLNSGNSALGETGR